MWIGFCIEGEVGFEEGAEFGGVAFAEDGFALFFEVGASAPEFLVFFGLGGELVPGIDGVCAAAFEEGLEGQFGDFAVGVFFFGGGLEGLPFFFEYASAAAGFAAADELGAVGAEGGGGGFVFHFVFEAVVAHDLAHFLFGFDEFFLAGGEFLAEFFVGGLGFVEGGAAGGEAAFCFAVFLVAGDGAACGVCDVLLVFDGFVDACEGFAVAFE